MALEKYRLSIVFDYMLHNGVIVKKAKAMKYMRKKHVLVDLIKVYTDLDIALPNILTTCVFLHYTLQQGGPYICISPSLSKT